MIKPFTKYKITSLEQLLEIKEQCEKQGLDFYPKYSDSQRKAKIIYIHELGTGWDTDEDYYPEYELLEWVKTKDSINTVEQLRELARHYQQFNINSGDIELLLKAANELEELKKGKD